MCHHWILFFQGAFRVKLWGNRRPCAGIDGNLRQIGKNCRPKSIVSPSQEILRHFNFTLRGMIWQNSGMIDLAPSFRLLHIFRVLGLTLLCMAIPAIATLSKDQDGLKSALEHYLSTQTQGLPGKVSYSIGQLDPATQLSPCSAFEPFLPTGSRLWGKSTLGVRCLGPSTWTIYIPVQVSITGDYLVSSRSLPAGQVLGPTDVAPRSGDLGTLATSTLTEAAQALGKTLKHGIAAGQPLRADQLVAPWAVQQGQSVKLTSKGSGFSVSNEGKALNNAVDGQVTQVRTSSGQVVSGIARAGGIVDISY